MNIAEVDINIMSVPQSYYIVNAISKDLNFNIGLPALFDRMYNMKEKIETFYTDSNTNELCFDVGESIIVDNVFNLVVKESSYDRPNKDDLLRAIEEMKVQMQQEMVTKIAIPKICCGKNGLSWIEVKAMIELVFATDDVNIIVCTNGN